jgi:hypothetical protein
MCRVRENIIRNTRLQGEQNSQNIFTVQAEFAQPNPELLQINNLINQINQLLQQEVTVQNGGNQIMTINQVLNLIEGNNEPGAVQPDLADEDDQSQFEIACIACVSAIITLAWLFTFFSLISTLYGSV